MGERTVTGLVVPIGIGHYGLSKDARMGLLALSRGAVQTVSTKPTSGAYNALGVEPAGGSR